VDGPGRCEEAAPSTAGFGPATVLDGLDVSGSSTALRLEAVFLVAAAFFPLLGGMVMFQVKVL